MFVLLAQLQRCQITMSIKAQEKNKISPFTVEGKNSQMSPLLDTNLDIQGFHATPQPLSHPRKFLSYYYLLLSLSLLLALRNGTFSKLKICAASLLSKSSEKGMCQSFSLTIWTLPTTNFTTPFIQLILESTPFIQFI